MDRVIQFSRALIEALCLCALITVPLYFNIYSDRVFEHDKVAIFRSLALIMGALAVLTWALNASRTPLRQLLTRKSLRRCPIGLPVALFALAIMISVVFSITPRSSFWGTYLRPDGAYTALCYFIFFACAYAVLTTSRQVERFIAVIVLTSLPIVLYSILQRLGFDYQAWSGNTMRRVIGTIGNPIFFAAYLIMLFPLTVRQVMKSFKDAWTDTRNAVAHSSMCLIYILVGVLQIASMILSGSRGPVLALTVGGLLFVCMVLVRYRYYRLTLAAITLPFLLGLVLLIIPHDGPIKKSAEDTAITRFAHVLNPQYKTSRVRILIWGAMANVVSDNEAMTYPSGEKDILDPIRPLVGYGPETIVDAVSPFYPAELGQVEKRTQMPDRSHNETWDLIIQHGLFGLILFYYIVASLFLIAFDYLGLVSKPGARFNYALCCLGGCAVGTLVSLLRGGLPFIGLGLSLGLIAGVFAYLWLYAWQRRKAGVEEPLASAPPYFTLMVALTAAVMAHFAEIQVGIGAITTRTFFWIFAALILVIQQRSIQPMQPRDDASEFTPVRYGMIWSSITALILGSILYNVLTIYNTPPEILHAPFRLFKARPWLGVLIVAVWFLIPLMATMSRSRSLSFMRSFALLICMLFASGMMTWAYVSWHTGGQADLGAQLYQSVEHVKQNISGFGYLFSRYCYFVFIVGIIAAFGLVNYHAKVKATFSPLPVACSAVLLVIAISAIYSTNVRIIHANMCFKAASGFVKVGKLDSAETMYQHAIDLAPLEDRYFFGIAQAVHGKAKIARTRKDADAEMKRAIELSKHAHDLNPLKPDHLANIALLYRWWAESTKDAFVRRQRGEVADEYYDAALTLLPQYVPYWCDRAVLHFNVLQSPATVEKMLIDAIELDPKYVPSHLLIGDHYARMGKTQKKKQKKTKLFKKAVTHYEEAIKQSGKKGLDNPYPVHVAASRAYGELEDITNLLYHAEKAYPFAPDQERKKLAVLIESTRNRIR